MATKVMKKEVYRAHKSTVRKQIMRRYYKNIAKQVAGVVVGMIAIACIMYSTYGMLKCAFAEDIEFDTKAKTEALHTEKEYEALTPALPITVVEIPYTEPQEVNSESNMTDIEIVETSIVEEVDTQETSTTINGYTDEDYQYLLMTIVGEAQNCSKQHQMYVGSVVLNRLNNKKYFSYANTIKDVVLAKGQYACFSDGNAYKTPTDLNKEVARELLENGSVLPSNVIFQAQFVQGDGIYEQIGNTYFCYKD